MGMTATTTGLPDTELARRLATGDQLALAELYDRYGALAYSLALRVLGRSDAAEDVVQEVFYKLWRNAGRFDSSKGSLRTWLTTAIRNRCIDHLRGRKRREQQELMLTIEVESDGDGSDPAREASLMDERLAVREALARLPHEQRRSLELAYFGGFTSRDIAEQMGVPISTVKGRIRLALEKLHVHLDGRVERPFQIAS